MRRREQKAQQYVKGGWADVAGLLQALSYGCSCVCVWGWGVVQSREWRVLQAKHPPPLSTLESDSEPALTLSYDVGRTEDGEGFVGPKSAWL